MDDTVSHNKAVSLPHAIHDQNGHLFEQYGLPVAYAHGVNGPLFEKIGRALEGARAGDKAEVMLPPQGRFGDREPGLTFADDIANCMSAAGGGNSPRLH